MGSCGDPDHGGAQRMELVGRLGELVRLDRATGREGGRIEIQHHRTLVQGLGERELERFTGERSIRAEGSEPSGSAAKADCDAARWPARKRMSVAWGSPVLRN